MVFDGVISPSRQHLRHLSPLATVSSVRQKEDPLLMQHPFHLEDGGVEVVVPPLPTLLAQSSLDELGDERPTLRAVFLDQFANQVVFFLCPGFLSKEFGFWVVGFGHGVVGVLLGKGFFEGLLYHLLKFELVVILKITAGV